MAQSGSAPRPWEIPPRVCKYFNSRMGCHNPVCQYAHVFIPCRYEETGQHCPHGDACYFAHSIKFYQLGSCLFIKPASTSYEDMCMQLRQPGLQANNQPMNVEQLPGPPSRRSASRRSKSRSRSAHGSVHAPQQASFHVTQQSSSHAAQQPSSHAAQQSHKQEPDSKTDDSDSRSDISESISVSSTQSSMSVSSTLSCSVSASPHASPKPCLSTASFLTGTTMRHPLDKPEKKPENKQETVKPTTKPTTKTLNFAAAVKKHCV